jgi:hypothetical protein
VEADKVVAVAVGRGYIRLGKRREVLMRRSEIEMRGGGVALSGWQSESVGERVGRCVLGAIRRVLVAQSYPQSNGLDPNVLVPRC